MTRIERHAITRCALALARCCDRGTVADVLNGLLCCDAEPALDDKAAEAGEALFDLLCGLVPEAAALAQTR